MTSGSLPPPPLELDEEGRAVRSPAVAMLIDAARRVVKAWEVRRYYLDPETMVPVERALRHALRAVDIEGQQIATAADILGGLAGELASAVHGVTGATEAKSLPSGADPGLQTSKPGGFPSGSDVASELPTPGASVTPSREK